MQGSGGIGVVTIRLDEPLFWVIAVVAVLPLGGGLWKIWKIVWAAFSG